MKKDFDPVCPYKSFCNVSFIAKYICLFNFLPPLFQGVYDSSVEDVCGGNADLTAQGCPITQATRLGCYICIWRSIPLQWLLSLD